jgi:hypothetical protein
MFHRELVGAAVAAGGESNWLKSIAEAEAVLELLCREVRAVEGVRQDGEPSSCALGPDGLAGHGAGLVGHQFLELKVGLQVPGFGNGGAAGPGGEEVCSHVKG